MPGAALITGCTVHTPDRVIPKASILIRGGTIAALGAVAAGDIPAQAERHRFEGCLAVPGFIDIHLHGGLAADFIDASPDDTVRALRAHLRSGTTALLPTLLSAPPERILRAIETLRAVQGEHGEIPEILGFNLEGPCLSEAKRGAHDPRFLRPVAAAELETLWKASGKRLRLMTVAPERPEAADLIRRLRQKRIIVSAGHTDADFLQTTAAVKRGVRLGTHLFNAMRGLLHREPGAAGALLLNDNVWVEVIADGEHLHPSVVRMIGRIKPPDKVILVTDAARTYGLQRAAARTAEGTLAGASTPLPAALKNYLKFTGLPLALGLRAVTLNPAELLGVGDRIGRLRQGADADIVILGRDLRPRAVYFKGRLFGRAGPPIGKRPARP